MHAQMHAWMHALKHTYTQVCKQATCHHTRTHTHAVPHEERKTSSQLGSSQVQQNKTRSWSSLVRTGQEPSETHQTRSFHTRPRWSAAAKLLAGVVKMRSHFRKKTEEGWKEEREGGGYWEHFKCSRWRAGALVIPGVQKTHTGSN